MGFLTNGKTLTWEEVIEYIPYIKEHGITQLLNIWNKVKDREKDCLKWGDEVCHFISKTESKKKYIIFCLFTPSFFFYTKFRLNI